MSRIIEKTVYQYDELSEDAKQTAREWYANGLDYDWWTDTYEDLGTTASIVGIAVDKRKVKLMGGGTREDYDFSFDLGYRNSFHFTGYYSYDKGWKELAKKEYGKDVFTRDTKEDKTAAFLQEWDKLQHSIQRPAFYGLSCKISSCSWNNGMSLDCRHITTTGYENYATDAQEKDLEELIELFQVYALSMLNAEWDYLNSDEAIEESIRANDYEFDECGNAA